jgi:hypothetical protein
MKARMENPALILPGALEALRAVHAAKKKRSCHRWLRDA